MVFTEGEADEGGGAQTQPVYLSLRAGEVLRESIIPDLYFRGHWIGGVDLRVTRPDAI